MSYRFRLEYVHYPTSGRLTFTVPVEADGSVGAGIARRHAGEWLAPTGRAHEFIFLSSVEVRHADPQ